MGYRHGPPAVLTQFPAGLLTATSGPRLLYPTLVPACRNPATPAAPAQLAGEATGPPSFRRETRAGRLPRRPTVPVLPVWLDYGTRAPKLDTAVSGRKLQSAARRETASTRQADRACIPSRRPSIRVPPHPARVITQTRSTLRISARASRRPSSRASRA